MALRNVLLCGDGTTRGGKILQGSELYKDNGRPIAYLGCAASCPSCGNIVRIVEGCTAFLISVGSQRVPVALDGALLSCGARAIGASACMRADDGGSTASTLVTLEDWYLNEVHPQGAPADSPRACDAHFVLHDAATHRPAAHVAYGIDAPNGLYESSTAEDGTTSRVRSAAPKDVTLQYCIQTAIGVRA